MVYYITVNSITLSPWLAQLRRQRADHTYNELWSPDVTIVGGGIAGASTAYFILTRTDASVGLLEANRYGHGATGHNAGQIVSYFEKPFAEIVREYGVDRAAATQAGVESAWGLLEEIRARTHIRVPFNRFTGYAGCSSFSQVTKHLEDCFLISEVGLIPEQVFIDEKWLQMNPLPKRYDGFYVPVPDTVIKDYLETNNSIYIAALAGQKGCMNSAWFTEELMGWLLSEYPERFWAAEQTPVRSIALHSHECNLDISQGRVVTTKKVVLCTNGFENFSIINNVNSAKIDSFFHDEISGFVSYMTAYTEKRERPPLALSYFHTPSANHNDPYFYLTRRPFDLEETSKGVSQNLICVGGPEMVLPAEVTYERNSHFPESTVKEFSDFLKDNFRHTPHPLTHTYLWHGLMGYTRSGLRLVGPEPEMPRLLYNLGCNGVGILPSLFGAHRISSYIRGEVPPPCAFDPLAQRNLQKKPER